MSKRSDLLNDIDDVLKDVDLVLRESSNTRLKRNVDALIESAAPGLNGPMFFDGRDEYRPYCEPECECRNNRIPKDSDGFTTLCQDRTQDLSHTIDVLKYQIELFGPDHMVKDSWSSQWPAKVLLNIFTARQAARGYNKEKENDTESDVV